MKHCLVCIGASWGHEVYVRLWQPPGVQYRSVSNDPVLSPPLTSVLGEQEWRYIFFLNWSEILPERVTSAFECVNFHCTPLPFGRGGHPIENLLLRGHTETVITAHRMTADIDTGPMYGRRGPVSLAGTKDEILARFVEPVSELMRRIVETEPTPIPQVGEVVRFQRLTPESYEAFWQTRLESMKHV